MLSKALLLIFLFSAQLCVSQHLSITNNKSVDVYTIQTVINELNKPFIINKDSLLQKTENLEKFRSNICLQNAQECIVTNYTNQRVRGNFGNIVWFTKLSEQPDFIVAKNQFKKIFEELYQQPMYYNTELYKLNANYIEPIAQKDYASFLFEMGKNKRMQISVQMYKKGNNWLLQMEIYEAMRIAD
jgi:hypothetical protein